MNTDKNFVSKNICEYLCTFVVNTKLKTKSYEQRKEGNAALDNQRDCEHTHGIRHRTGNGKLREDDLTIKD